MKEKELENKRIRKLEKQEDERTKQNLLTLEKEKKRNMNSEKRIEKRRQKAAKN